MGHINWTIARRPAAIVGALTLLLSACAPAAQSTPGSGVVATQAASTPVATPLVRKKVVFAQATRVPDAGTIWWHVPLAAKYFEQEGIEIEIIPNAGGGDALKQVAQKQAHFSIGSPENTLNAVLEGVPLRAVATVVTSQIFRMVVLPNSPIKGYAELKGKKLGVSSFTSGSYPFAKFALRENGLDFGKDVEFVTVGTGAPAYEALKTGRVDALSTWDTQIATFEGLGPALRVFPRPSIGELPADQILVLPDTLTSDPDLVERFLRAIFKGIIFAQTNPEAAVDLYIKQFPEAAKGQDREGHLRILKSRLPQLELVPSQQGRWGFIPLAQYEKLQSAGLEFGTIKAKQDLSLIMSNQVIEAANKFDVEKVKQEARAFR